MAIKIWSRLADSTKKKYRSQGVSPQRYNAWVKTGKATKESLAAKGVSRDEFLKASTTKDVKRAAAERLAVAHMTKTLLKSNSKTLAKNVKAMTGGELYIASKAGLDKLRMMASAKGYRVVSWSREPINPFWYN